MYSHQDFLKELNKNLPLNEKLVILHNVLKQRVDFIDRIAIALYDAKTDLLKTFIDSSGGTHPLVYYEAKLSEVKSLQEVLQVNCPRIVNDLAIFDRNKSKHSEKIQEQGYGSSYTLPMYLNNTFWGFIFFNSYQKNCFKEELLYELDLIGHLISSIITNELRNIKTMLAALKTANDMVHYRDPETGGHLERMARFSRLIAQDLAKAGIYNLKDDFIEWIYMYSPMHDVGKIGIPDSVLLKPGKLTESEFEVMKTHTLKGKAIINLMIENFSLESFEGVDILRNIAVCHHETMDGNGYPYGLKNGEIPLEARIIAVADIFDALTSKRPYKTPWSNEDAFAMLERLSKTKLDKDCVISLMNSKDKVIEIQKDFQDKDIED
ncbi:MAG: HD domain-containing protein [Acidobacteria bacterium]|nr:HD domain-containing protein [Acidobacteriota bacterium]